MTVTIRAVNKVGQTMLSTTDGRWVDNTCDVEN